jgi:hypothetical protein
MSSGAQFLRQLNSIDPQIQFLILSSSLRPLRAEPKLKSPSLENNWSFNTTQDKSGALPFIFMSYIFKFEKRNEFVILSVPTEGIEMV